MDLLETGTIPSLTVAKRLARTADRAWLFQTLTALNDAYRDGFDLAPDHVYDFLYEHTQALYPDDPFFARVGGGMAYLQSPFVLPNYMSSRDKKLDGESAMKWLDGLNSAWVCVAFKLDGVAAQLLYRQGKLVTAATQGKDGRTGGNITRAVQRANLPLELPEPLDLDIRVELILPRSARAQCEAAGYTKGLRATVAGIINASTAVNPLIELVDAVGLQIYNAQMPLSSQLSVLQEYGFKIPKYRELETDSITPDLLSEMFAFAKAATSEYDADGLVLTDDGYAPPPETDGNPAWSIAYKESLAVAHAETEVVDVVYDVGKRGRLTPRVITKPVQVGDVIATSFSGFNGRFILTGLREDEQGPHMPVGIGAKLRVERAGDVVPYIIEVLEGAAEPLLPDVPYEQVGVEFMAVEDDSGNVALRRTVKRLDFFLKALRVKGAADKTITKAIQGALAAGKVSTPYAAMTAMLCEPDLWVEFGGLNEGRAAALLDALDDALDGAGLGKVLFASSAIPGVGESTATAIAAHLPWLRLLPTVAELQGAANRVKWFAEAGYQDSKAGSLEADVASVPDCGGVTAQAVAAHWDEFRQFCFDLNIFDFPEPETAGAAGSQWLSAAGKQAAGTVPGSYYLTGFRNEALDAALTALGMTKCQSFNAKTCTLLVAKKADGGAFEKKRSAMLAATQQDGTPRKVVGLAALLAEANFAAWVTPELVAAVRGS